MDFFIIITPPSFVTLLYNYVKYKKNEKNNDVSINVGISGFN